MNAKKIGLGLVLFANYISAQYLIVGNDSISLAKFKEEYKYGLENAGVDKTIKSYEDFHLIQQFSQAKKVDTTAFFGMSISRRIEELKKNNFYPKEVSDVALNEYLKGNQKEKKILIFFVKKEKDDKNDYQKIYQDVISGKVKIEEAIKTYTKGQSEPIYMKSGALDPGLEQQFQNLPVGGFTKLTEDKNVVVFGQYLGERPSLGYIIFGTLSYKNDADAEKNKKLILEAFRKGDKFEKVTSQYSSDPNEKANGGVVMGSPTLPDEVYNILKNLKKGEHTAQPILIQDKWYFFNVYDIKPYVRNPQTDDFFLEELKQTQYVNLLYTGLVDWMKKKPEYKEYPEFQKIKSSFEEYQKIKGNPILYSYGGHQFDFNSFKKNISDKVQKPETLTPEIWSKLVMAINDGDLYILYMDQFAEKPDIKAKLQETKKNLYSDYFYNSYLKAQIDEHPELLSQYYKEHKDKYMWEQRAQGRVAILLNNADVEKFKKEMKDPANWNTLKKENQQKLNEKKQLLVNFEEGDMSQNADIFVKNKVPFAPGVYVTKLGERSLVIAIDKILPVSQMTELEAKEQLKDDVTEHLLNKTIEEQRAKTKITVQPEFLQALYKEFKK